MCCFPTKKKQSSSNNKKNTELAGKKKALKKTPPNKKTSNKNLSKKIISNKPAKQKDNRMLKKGGYSTHKLENLRERYPAVIVLKTYCPHCRAALKYLKSVFNQSELKIVEINRDPENFQSYIKSKYSHRTVPAIFIGKSGPFGNSNLPRNDKKLKEMAKK